MSRRAVALLVAAASLGCTPRPAVTPAVASTRADAGLTDAEVTRRLAFIEGRLRAGTPAAERWWTGWLAGFTALTLGQAVVALATTDPGLRKDAAVGAASSSLGVIPLGLFPFPDRYAAAAVARLAASTPALRREKLARAEALLEKCAEADAAGRAWTAHALSAGVSIGVGLVQAFVYDRPRSGVLSAVGGVGLSEAQIFTRPTAAIEGP